MLRVSAGDTSAAVQVYEQASNFESTCLCFYAGIGASPHSSRLQCFSLFRAADR